MGEKKKLLIEGRGEKPTTPRPSLEALKQMRGEKPKASPQPSSDQSKGNG